MSWKTLCLVGLTATASLLRPGEAIAQGGAGRDFEAEIEAALRSAKTAAGFEFLGALNRNCLLPASGGLNTSNNLPRYVQDPTTIPPRERWYAESAQVFDNLYFVGGRIHSSWALTTSEGIIIIDTLYPYNSEESIVGGLERVGLDPADIRYVIISHAHGDHIGGAQILIWIDLSTGAQFVRVRAVVVSSLVVSGSGRERLIATVDHSDIRGLVTT